MAQAGMPLEVLGDVLADEISGRHVRTAVFTTFTFDPGFFELHVLPLLFDRPFSQVDKVRLIQLEDALRSVDEVAVYYDRTALIQGGTPAQSDFRRIDVRRATGVFHPKMVMVLVENPDEAEEEDDESQFRPPKLSLIVGTLSANLTRPGWWENVETGHFEEIQDWELDDKPCSFRKDLLSVIQRIRSVAAEGEKHKGLDRIHQFLRQRTVTEPVKRTSFGGSQRARIYSGQSDLPSWLDELRLSYKEWNLEIISPYFDAQHAGTLEALIGVLEPRETRVFLPTNSDGSAAVRTELYEAVSGLAAWSALPKSICQAGGRAASEKLPLRRVHAKVYRLWRKNYKDIVLTGSVNLTSAAHSHGNAGNLEAAFLVDVTDELQKRWWLEPLDRDPKIFAQQNPDEAEDTQDVFVDIGFRFDWAKGSLEYRVEGKYAGSVDVSEPGGRLLFRLNAGTSGTWRRCSDDDATQVRELLKSTSFLLLGVPQGSWRVLVREEGLAHRPSLLSELTPEEILMYWSLLSPEQREAFIEKKLAAEGVLEGLPVTRSDRYSTQDSVFDRFAGVYHAFERLSRHVQDSITAGHEREAESRMFGAKYDSLPVLLNRTLERSDGDSVIDYVTFLCAKQVRDRVARTQSDFWSQYRSVAKGLDDVLENVPKVRERVAAEVTDSTDFLDWYERMFLRAIEMPEDES